MHPDDAIHQHYAQFDEDARLSGAFGEFEYLRTRELIARYLPAAPADIIDIGGGTGAYAFWLAGFGHRVHLVDLVPRHIDIAAARATRPGQALTSMTVGDARRLAFPDASADLIVFAGPLYHLIERHERMLAIEECHRVLRRGGILLSVAINRYAGVIYGLTQGLVFEQSFFDMAVRELATGIRTDPPLHMRTFRHAYFHLPTEMTAELSGAGFRCQPCLGVVGPAWQVPDLHEAWADPRKRDTLLSLARQLESECILSPQLFCAARK